MLFLLWSILSLSRAVEGLDMVIQSPTSLQSFNDPWNLQIAHQFWVQPVVNQNGNWSMLPVSDVLVQRFAVQHRVNSGWSIHAQVPMIFVGSKELYRSGNRTFGTKYHTQVGRWNGAVGLDVLSKGVSSTELAWSKRGLYPELQLHRMGTRWLIDAKTGVYWMQGLHPNIDIILQQNKTRSMGVGFNGAWLTNAFWSSASLRWTQHLDDVSISLLYQIPALQRVSVKGSIFEVQLSYRPPDLKPKTDRDGDGFLNSEDECTDEAEDFDGFEDGDGCPENDNDLDGLNDDVDSCPMFVEDIDGFEDEDGCPDPDNDRDNILDIVDRCPSQPETVNQYQDLDGCPDEKSHPDFDGDGLWDDRDNCPFHPEDKDGIQDEDGCPDPDSMIEWQEILQPKPDDSNDDTDAEK